MKVLVVAVVVLAAFLQVGARSIGINQELPKAARETMEQSLACIIQMGPDKALNVFWPQGLQPLPEDNESLHQLWGCIFVKKGIINHENKVNEEKLHTYLMDMFTMFVSANDELKTMANDITDTCKDVEAGEYQLKALRIQNCINHSLKEITGL